MPQDRGAARRGDAADAEAEGGREEARGELRTSRSPRRSRSSRIRRRRRRRRRPAPNRAPRQRRGAEPRQHREPRRHRQLARPRGGAPAAEQALSGRRGVAARAGRGDVELQRGPQRPRAGAQHRAKLGVPALDEEVLAMVQRAQPLPAFPPAMTQQSINLVVPIRFYAAVMGYPPVAELSLERRHRVSIGLHGPPRRQCGDGHGNENMNRRRLLGDGGFGRCDRWPRWARASVSQPRRRPAGHHPRRPVRRRVGRFGDGLGARRPALRACRSRWRPPTASRPSIAACSSTRCRKAILPPRRCSKDCRRAGHFLPRPFAGSFRADNCRANL